MPGTTLKADVDLRDEALAKLAAETASYMPHVARDVTHSVREAMFLNYRRIRDAATAAERQRAIAIVERQPYYSETAKWVKDQILAALCGGDHE